MRARTAPGSIGVRAIEPRSRPCAPAHEPPAHTTRSPTHTYVRRAKILSPAAKRRAVDMLKDTLSMSDRLACKAVGLARSTYRRLPLAATPADPDAQLRAWLRCYAPTHPCHGFPRDWAALRPEEG